jgi:hypothetical protein
MIPTDASFAIFFLQADASLSAAKVLGELQEVSSPKGDLCDFADRPSRSD